MDKLFNHDICSTQKQRELMMSKMCSHRQTHYINTQFSTCTYFPGGGNKLRTAALCVCGTLVASYWLFQRKPANIQVVQYIVKF